MDQRRESTQPMNRSPYRWLPALIAVMAIVALFIGGLLLHYVETRLVASSGEELTLAAAEISEKLDRLLFERYSDTLLTARAFAVRSTDKTYLAEHLAWMKSAYAPVYLWLGVTDAQGRIIAATDPSLVGQDHSRSVWFESAKKRGRIVVADAAIHEADNGIETVAFTAPIQGKNGEFLGVVTTRVGIPMLEEVVTRTIRALEMRDGRVGQVEYQMMTRTGAVFGDSDLAHKGPMNLKAGGLPSASLSQVGEPGYVEEIHLRRGIPVVTGYAQTKGYGEFPGLQWTVLVRMDRDAILSPIRAVLWKVGVAGAIVWFPLVALLFWATGRLRTQYQQAQEESARARAAEAALLQSQERNRAIVDTALDGVITMDAAGVITDWNAQATKIFGWARDEALGRLLSDTIIPPPSRAAHERGLQEFLATGKGPILNQRIEITAYHHDGHEFPVELAISPARIGESYIFSAFVRDITVRKRTERRLASQYAVSRVLADAATLEEASPKILQAICESLEWELGVLWRLDKVGNVLRCLDLWRAPSLQAEEFVTATWQHTFQVGAGLPGRIWASGEPAWIPDVTNEDNFPRAAVAGKSGLHGAFGFPIRVGGEVEGVIELYSQLVRGPDEELLKMVADVGLKIGQFGERTRAEDALEQAEAQLRQSQKMEAVGRLAGGVAHDFNNLLTVIRGYSELILNRLVAGDALHKEMEEVKKAADRAAGLTGQLLAFSRRQFIAPKLVDLNVVVASVDGMLRRLLGEDIIELCTVLDPELGQIKADPGQLDQVIMNLAVNARDAMANGGQLTVETRNVDIPKWGGRRPEGIEPGSFVLLSVRDTGHGMDEETKSHLFEPFFTTKEKGKGTGLGLSTVYGIVKQSGGSLEVESSPGQGATFKIYFPRVDGTLHKAESAAGGGERARGKETVLLVEDEPSVRGLVHETLRLHGYTVLEARHGIEALLTGAKHVGPIHLLLTDVVMPQMSGPEVAEKLSTIRPEMKVLYMSGYPDHPVFSQAKARTDTAFLQKPFAPNQLAKKVRDVLDAVKAA